MDKLQFLKLKQRCADPLQCHKGECRKSDRIVTNLIMKRLPHFKLTKNHRLCKNCRKNLDQMARIEREPETSSSEESSIGTCTLQPEKEDSEAEFMDYDLSDINTSFQAVGESPFKLNKALSRQTYTTKKITKLTKKVTEKLMSIKGDKGLNYPSTSKESSEEEKYFHEMIEQLKDKFNNTSKRSTKISILTILPNSWTERKIATEFDTSRRMASNAKKLYNEKGPLANPNSKPGKTIDENTAEKIRAFYLSEDMSRVMPGSKDYVSVSINGERSHVQKHLVLCNLKEAFASFKDNHPSVKIGFSKFAELRPKQCVLAGSSGTHSVCVCTIHQNLKLMHIGAKFDKLYQNQDTDMKHPRNWLKFITCTSSMPECHLNKCQNCGDTRGIREKMHDIFDANSIDSIQFKRWTTTDRSNFETVLLNVDDFINTFCSQLIPYRKHDFIAKTQAASYREIKESLKSGEFLIVLDFAENYTMVMQDEIQSYHWNNEMATIHPFVIYYFDENKTEIAHKSFVIISECNIHDTIAVYTFQKHLINFMKKTWTPISKIMYFSDGCAGQYKNHKNFINLCYHKNDFGIEAEWHFFATSHGKGPCDGVGGTVKRLAKKASLQRPYEDQIQNPLDLYKFAKTDLPTIYCQYATIDEYSHAKLFLEKRFLESKTIAGTRGLHSFTPKSLNTVTVKEYTADPNFRIESFTKRTVSGCNLIENITGYVIVVYDKFWWLAMVLKTFPEENEVEVSFLNPHGPNQSYYYPNHPDILIINKCDIIAIVDPTTPSGRTYILSMQDTKKAEIGLRNSLI
jgi:hypothetical protein